MSAHPAYDRLTGVLLLATAIVVTAKEWTGHAVFMHAAAVGALVVTLMLSLGAARGGRIFALIALGLSVFAASTRPDWLDLVVSGLSVAAFVAAFFSALATLRNASVSSPAIGRLGQFLAEQPPGRRYLALTAGGHLFGLTLNYGAIQLFGGLVEATKREPVAEIRTIRIRRMLLAVQRGFVSSLTWSPLAFSIAISVPLIAGASWSGAVGAGLVSSAILAGLGWALDTIYKPRRTAVPPRNPTEGSWTLVWPLFLLLAIIVTILGGLNAVTGVRVVGVVMLAVPLLALGWIALQKIGRGGASATLGQVDTFLFKELPGYRGELLLLMMAGFLGTVGGRILLPWAVSLDLNLASAPTWAILLGIVWAIPVSGQLGMNPILFVSLIAPLLPSPGDMGVQPSAVICAITAGWALSGASSPFTATTTLLGSLGGVSAIHVGLVWNGLYTLLAGLALSGWVLLFARIVAT
ncbi:MAG: hypothetical protein AAGC70_06305 [Pseudomonadota bacterium]